ncbi:hypothetical protein FQN54_008678 [Arachnomyces sp. PD_36]|nr:hypothetical protein FQN54_008678 [Arachnomyces sp. PD_36]
MKPSTSQPKLRRSSTLHYQTFAASPPKSRGRPLSDQSGSSHDAISPESRHHNQAPTSSPLPKRQMAVLAFIALSEQTALNSISPYLPDMASTFPGVEQSQVGVFVGTIASAFALAQCVTNFFWGWLSDRIGRKPVILLGTILTAACFIAFGFCRTLWQAIVVQAFMGAVNGNQGVVSTCLGEITDRSNQSKAFTYLPVLYGLGAITGPILGGLLVSGKGSDDDANHFRYLGPNLVSAAILVVDFIITIIYLDESLEDARTLPQLGRKIVDMFSWLWQFTSSSRPVYLGQHRRFHGDSDETDSDDESDSSYEARTTNAPLLQHRSRGHELTSDEILNRDTLLLLLTYLLFALSNISFNSLYPIFAQAPEPTGRDFTPREIGLSLAFSGAVTILFQIFIFGKLRDKMGNKWSYRAGIFGFVVSFILMPFVGYKSTKGGDGSHNSFLLAVEVCVVLLVKTVASVGGLTSALLLITNSAPNHSVLGSLNGLAQTLSAAGRAAGPFLSGGLFSLATNVKPKGEALAFGVFGCVAFIGFIMSFGIRSPDLEAEGWSGDEDEPAKSDDEENQSPISTSNGG